MYGRIVLQIDSLKEDLELIKEYFKPISFKYLNEDEIDCFGKSFYFEQEYGLHNIILLDDNALEFWSIKEYES